VLHGIGADGLDLDDGSAGRRCRLDPTVSRHGDRVDALDDDGQAQPQSLRGEGVGDGVPGDAHRMRSGEVATIACSIRSTRKYGARMWRARCSAVVDLPVAGRPPTTTRTAT
jgi:hypothetical protein